MTIETIENQNSEDLGIRPVTIHIDPSLHTAMRELAKKRQVHLSYVYAEAVESYLDQQVAKQSKKTLVR